MSKKEDNSILLIKSPLYIGFDESNHGAYPEVFAAVYSTIREDVVKHEQKKISKKRNPSQLRDLVSKLKRSGKRDYSFLLALKTDYERIPSKEFPGIVAASLIKDWIKKDLGGLVLFFDGVMESQKKIYTKDLILEVCEFDRKKILIKSGPIFDRRYPLVNYADSIAHHYFLNSSPHKLSKDPRMKPLIK